jgi:hypothetical protein
LKDVVSISRRPSVDAREGALEAMAPVNVSERLNNLREMVGDLL